MSALSKPQSGVRIMNTPRKGDEILVSQVIRQMRSIGHMNFAEVSTSLFGGYRNHSLIPWRSTDIPRIISDKDAAPDVAGTDLRFIYKAGGRPWPTQLIRDRQLTPERHSSYLLDKSNKTTHLRYCDECAKAQLNAEGFSWWRLSHNLPGVVSCQEHLAPLRDVTWEAATQNWGLLPHNIPYQPMANDDDACALEFSRLVRQIEMGQMRFCPFIVATTALESIRQGEGCSERELLGAFMKRFSWRFPQKVLARIGKNEATPPDLQVQRLITDGVLVSPLATVLIASTIYPDMESFKRSYLNLLKGSVPAPTGEFLPGKRLDRALNWYPQFALRTILH